VPRRASEHRLSFGRALEQLHQLHRRKDGVELHSEVEVAHVGTDRVDGQPALRRPGLEHLEEALLPVEARHLSAEAR
jgi:hypothetical protein